MCSGVEKSGWPIPRLIIERPCASSALARASTSNADSVPSRPMRPAICNMLAPPLAMPPSISITAGDCQEAPALSLGGGAVAAVKHRQAAEHVDGARRARRGAAVDGEIGATLAGGHGLVLISKYARET